MAFGTGFLTRFCTMDVSQNLRKEIGRNGEVSKTCDFLFEKLFSFLSEKV